MAEPGACSIQIGGNAANKTSRMARLRRFKVSTAGTEVLAASGLGTGQDDSNRDCLSRDRSVNLVCGKTYTAERHKAFGVERAEVQGSATETQGGGKPPTKFQQGGAAEAHTAHNREVVGSNPTPATRNSRGPIVQPNRLLSLG